MSWILNIETSSPACSVALAKDGKLVAIRESDVSGSHAALCSVYAKEVADEAGITFTDFNAVAVSEGPGSYTGLRIGASVAKGICFACNIPLIAIPTLRAMAEEALELKKDKTALYIPMVDARRMEVYSAVYNYSGEEISPAKPVILDGNSYSEFMEGETAYMFGSGSAKAIDVINNSNATFINIFGNSAKNMVHLSQIYYNKKNFTHINSFEPKYLKLFQNILNSQIKT